MTIPCYIPPSALQRAPIALEYQSLIGNQGHVNTVVAGATSLPLQENTTLALLQNARVYIFDGLQTEMVTVSAPASSGVNALSVSPLQYAHSAGTEYLTDGVSGSLAESLFYASKRIEARCNQSLLQQTHTDLQRLRVEPREIQRVGGLKINPVYYPVTAITSLSLQYDNILTDPIVIDVTQLIINPTTYSVLLPYLQLIQAAVLYADDSYDVTSMRRGFMATMIYSSGFAFTAMPYDIERAAILYACVDLLRRSNALQAQEISQNKRKVTFHSPSDLSGISDYEKEADRLLERGSYVRKGHTR